MQIGITTIQRDRAPWIKEWLAFHYLVGFRKFYIFAHNCQDNTNEIATELKKKFDIEVFNLDPELERPQMKCYQYSCENFLQNVDWMAFIDSDEFLFPTSHDSMEAALNEFSHQKISALGIYWVCFGSSGHIKEPLGLIVENYKQRANDGYTNNRHIKSIVRGGKVQGTIQIGANSHIFKTPWGTYDENLRPITNGLTNYEPTYKKFRINHYLCQSRSYYENWKKHSGCADGNKFKVREEDWWEEHNRNEVLDNSMDKFIGPLKSFLRAK